MATAGCTATIGYYRLAHIADIHGRLRDRVISASLLPFAVREESAKSGPLWATILERRISAIRIASSRTALDHSGGQHETDLVQLLARAFSRLKHARAAARTLRTS
jgi:hypothetical protein